MAKRSCFFLNQDSFVETFVTRSKLTKGTPPFIRTLTLNVIRNEVLEPFLSHSKDIASYFGIDIEIFYSDYSDLPNFPRGQCDLLLVWLNWDRYLLEGIQVLLSHLSLEIGNSNHKRYLIVEPSNIDATKKSKILRLPGAEELPWLRIPRWPVLSTWRNSGYSREEVKYVTDFVGVNLSQLTSRLECRAIVVDFDNTLYSGIFAEGYDYSSGEDEPYLLFRRHLKKLSDEGVVLVGATKNNQQDVDSIINSGLLDPLDVNDFVFIQSGWTSKVDTITKVISILNLDAGNILFVDDNIRELAEVSEVHPDLLCLNGTSPQEILDLLQRRIVFNAETSKNTILERRRDLRVRSKRIEILSDGLSLTTFHSKYNTKVQSRLVSIPADRERAISLFRKTNQFNFTFARLSETEFQSIDTPYNIIVGNLKDDLSDSGTIAAMVVLEHNGELEIRELCISCRALGRGVEKYVVMSMLSEVPGLRNGIPIFCKFVDQARNQVAKIFLEEYFSLGEKCYLDFKKLYQQTREDKQILK